MDPSARFLSLCLLLLFVCSTVFSTCPEADQIHCFTGSRCTRIRYICDGDNDCGDNSDEESELCRHWQNNDCDRNNAMCYRNGRGDCVTISYYCSLSNPPCNGSLDLRLCEMLKLEKLIPFNSITPPTVATLPTVGKPFESVSTGARVKRESVFAEPTPTEPSVHVREEDLNKDIDAKIDNTIRHTDCPQLFTRVGEQCVSIFYLGNVNWLEARAFCKAIGSDLFTLSSDGSNFATLMQHLSQSQVTTDFWIGGRYLNGSWAWVDNREMVLGSPYWAVRHSHTCATRSITSPVLNLTRTANDGECYSYVQAPAHPPAGECAALSYAQYYFVGDENCSLKKSPLCVLPSQGPKEAL